jgi:hypothetical protein
MKITGFAAIFTAVVLAGPVRGAQNEPPSKPMGSAGEGPIVGFQEEPDSFWVNSPKGRFQVVIEPSGRAARKAIHEARSKEFYGGKSIDAVQRDLASGNGLFKGGPAMSGASVIIGVAEDGTLVGANKQIGGSPSKMRLYAYGLNDEGTTRKVIISGGRRDKNTALFVRLLDANGAEKSWIVMTLDDTIVTGMDFQIQAR